MKFFQKHHPYKIVASVLLLDMLMLILHLFFGHISSFVHLDREYNLPTVYQSAKLIFVGGIAFFIFWQLWLEEQLDKKSQFFYGFFAAIFIFLGLDELGQLHENVDYFVRELFPHYADTQLRIAESSNFQSSTWMLYYLPIMTVAIIYFAYTGKYVCERIPGKKLVFSAMISLFILTLVLEFASNQGQVLPHIYEKYVTWEETAEMLGATAGLALMWEPFVKNSKFIREKLMAAKTLASNKFAN